MTKIFLSHSDIPVQIVVGGVNIDRLVVVSLLCLQVLVEHAREQIRDLVETEDFVLGQLSLIQNLLLLVLLRVILCLLLRIL